MRRTALLATTLLVTPLVLSAQSHPLVGTWTVSFTAGGRMEDGAFTPINGTGTLTVESVGDSLVANLVSNPTASTPAQPPRRMAAAAGPGEVVFVSRLPAQITLNDEVRDAVGVSTWKLKVNGDKLEGTTQQSLEGVPIMMPSLPPQPVTGTRNNG